MATKVLEFEGPEGLTLTVVSHPVDTPNSTITATSVTEQPLASVTVTVYVPFFMLEKALNFV